MLKEDNPTLFLHGACHVFALVLHETFDYPIVLLQESAAKQLKNATHVYCLLSEGWSVDVVGIAREQVALEELGWIGTKYRRLKVSPQKLQDYCTVTEGGGLYANEEFLIEARLRAKIQMEAFKDYYSGAIRASVPGLRRRAGSSPEAVQDLFS
jgi:hypothetical protein